MVVVLKANSGSVVRTREGSIAEVGSSEFGWEKVEVQIRRTEYRGVLEVCVAQDFKSLQLGEKMVESSSKSTI